MGKEESFMDGGSAVSRERFDLDEALKEEIRAKVLGEGFMKIVQSVRRGGAQFRISVRPVEIGGVRRYQAEMVEDGQVRVKNFDADGLSAGLEEIIAQKGARDLHLMTAKGDLHVRVTRKGRVVVSRSAEMNRAVTDQFTRYQNHVLKNIGGRESNNMPGREPQAFTAPQRQKEALQYLGRHVFTAPEWLYPENIINKVGINPTAVQNSRQETIINRLLSQSLLNNLCNQGEYPVSEYLDDLFAQVWKPAEGTPWQQKERRQLQRAYVLQIDRLLNPAPTVAFASLIDSSDALLYVLQHLDKIDEYLKQQANGTTLQALHCQELLRQTKLIREKRTTK